MVMMAEIQDVHMFKRKSLRVTIEKGHYARNYPKPRIRDSKYFIKQMLLAKQDEARVILTDEQNDFFFADALRMEEIKELSANICLMTRIQLVNIDSDAGPSYDYTFLSEVQTPSTNYVNPLFAKDNQEQKYPTQPKIINKSIGDDQTDSNIIFDEPNEDVNSGSVENDNNVQDLYELEQLARNAYKEAEKQQIIAKKQLFFKALQQPFISATFDYMYIKSYSFRLFSSLPGVLTPVRGESLKILNGFDVSLPVSHLLWSSQSFGHQKAINGCDMPLPLADCSGLVNPLAPRKGKFPCGLMPIGQLFCYMTLDELKYHILLR
ncbi:hypothetical protein Tco_0674935 [Tanacetum coccineum]